MRRFPLLQASLAVGTLLVLLLFSAIVRRNVGEMQMLREESTRITHTVEVQRQLDAVLLAEAHAGSAARAYLLTLGESSRDQLRETQRQSAERIETLAALTTDNQDQQRRVERLRDAFQRLNGGLATVVEARGAGTVRDALDEARVLDTSGARSDIRAIVSEMEQEEVRLLGERRQQADAAYERAVRGRVGSGAVSAALLVGIALSFLMHARAKSSREQVLIDSERRAREAATREQEARADAERANLQKDQFLAVLSHELRTPLNAVLGWTQILQAAGPKEPTVVRALASIRRNAEAQQRLVEDLLDVSRIIADKLPFERRRFELRAVVASAIESVRPAAAGKGLVIDARLQDAGTLEGDHDRIRQVAANLLANAVKFTPAGGRVEVSLARDTAAAVLEVRDSGVGFEPQLAAHVFERFRQGDASPTRAHGGLGLGLAIARHIVDAHGGTIEAESGGTDRGAVFRVRLPTG